MPSRLSLGLILTLTGSLIAAGQVEAQAPATCQEEAEFRQFDFWVGQWDVFTFQGGDIAGSNVIEARHGGCVLVENWLSTSGGGGTSMNFYDRVTRRWRQLWVSTNYSIDITGGLNQAGAMVLVGELHNYRPEQSFPFRGTWTPLPNGDVRQLFEQQDPETGAWDVWFDGRYVPMEDQR